MTLYERRSSLEAFDRSSSPATSERRKLSFNPIADWTPLHPPPIVSVPQPSTSTRLLQIGVAVVYCLLAAGVVFGYAALKPVLVAEGVYRSSCTAQERQAHVWVCNGQELRLNLMFTVAAVSTNVCALPVGTILDRFGPRVASLVGVAFLSLGAAGMAFAADLAPLFNAYVLAYLCLALGGPFVFISAFQLSNAFPAHSGLILALLTGAFDTSSAVFLVYRLLYQSSDGALAPKKFFLLYLLVPAFILLAQLFVMPHYSYQTPGELAKQAEDSSLDEPSDTTPLLPVNDPPRSDVWGALHGRPATSQIASPWFLLIALFTLVQMTRINYFVATVRTQYAFLLHSDSLAAQINAFFDLALPLGGILAIPFIGAVLDHTPTLFVLVLLVTTASLIGALGLVSTMWAARANVVLFVLYRPLYYTAVSDYCAKVFGFATFGKVYGLVICVAGVGNLGQTGLDALTHGRFGGDPRPVNGALEAVAGVIGVALVGFVAWRRRGLQREVAAG